MKGALAAAVLAALAAQDAPASPEPVAGTHLFPIEVAGTPEGLLAAVGLRARAVTRAEVFLDVIERLHFIPGRPPGMERYASTVTAFLDALRRVRRTDGTVSLEAVRANARARDRLEEFLRVAGFLLRRDPSGQLVVRPDPDGRAQARREALEAGGFPVADLDVRMNAGEAAAFAPVAFEIPSPLPAEVWRDTIFDDPDPGERLGFRLLADRRAALLYYGLLSMTPETVEFLVTNPKLLRDLYERDATGIALYGRSLVVEDGRVVAPGGPDAVHVWERAVRKPLDRPGDFFKTVLRYDEGVFPFLYDAIARLDAPRQRFALALWLPERHQRANFWRLYDVVAANVRFSRDAFWSGGFPDPTVLLSQVRTDDSGLPVGPAWSGLWNVAFDGVDLPQNAARDVQDAERSGPLEASRLLEGVFRDPAWIAGRTAGFLFAQRRFAGVAAADLPDAVTTLRGFPLFTSLVSTLDRIGVESPATYAAAVRHAAGLNRMPDREDARDALSQFQGALALLDGARHARSLSAAAAAGLAASAAAVRLDESRGYEGRMARWVAGELLPALDASPPAERPRGPSAAAGAGYAFAPRERIVVRALAGALDDDGRSHRTTIDWEGFSYIADLRGVTLARLLETRRLQSGASLDAALDLWAIADALAGGPDTVEEVERLSERLRSVGGVLPARPGPGEAVIVSQTLERTHEDLAQVRARGDSSRRTADAARRLLRLADAVLGDVLRALVYAAYLGDPRSGVLGSGDLSGRHEFGLDPYYRDPLRATAWRFPVPRMLADRPWHVEGALLGLALATADLRLQQIMTNQPPVASPMGSHERDGLAATVALFNPFGRTESETREIAKAVEAGRRRAMRLAESPDEVPPVATTAGLGRRRSALLAWTANREPDRLDEWLSMREFLWLGLEEMDAGESAAERLSGWGAYAGRLDGCLCLRLAPPRLRWENWRGRAGSGLMAALAADLTLWVGEGFAARALPVSLSGPVLEVAMRYMLDRVQPAHVEDWNTVLRYASRLRDADFEDYVSSLTGTDVLRPADLPARSRQQPVVKLMRLRRVP